MSKLSFVKFGNKNEQDVNGLKRGKEEEEEKKKAKKTSSPTRFLKYGVIE
jgi:hypothetical protein